MIVPLQEIIEEVAADSFTLRRLHSSIEQRVKDYIRWNPEQVTHTNKLYDGNGNASLFLDEMYISALIRVATIREDAIKIKNTTNGANAYFSVVYSSNAPASLTLSLNGTDTSLAFSTYTTIGSLITAIDALGSGWDADTVDSDFASYATTNLIEEYNHYCGSWAGKTPGWEYIPMAGEPISGVRLYNERGELWRSGSWPRGHRNIAISYTSGYALASMPKNLQDAVIMLVKYFYERDSQGTTGIKSYSLGHLSVTYQEGGSGAQSIPIDALDVLDYYQRPLSVR